MNRVKMFGRKFRDSTTRLSMRLAGGEFLGTFNSNRAGITREKRDSKENFHASRILFPSRCFAGPAAGKIVDEDDPIEEGGGEGDRGIWSEKCGRKGRERKGGIPQEDHGAVACGHTEGAGKGARVR
ncbi:hypothetical protein KM043_005239 [Ampulex compressa]|nr:hypothetical protein KM043_005239 [Ampulex compressa]